MFVQQDFTRTHPLDLRAPHPCQNTIPFAQPSLQPSLAPPLPPLIPPRPLRSLPHRSSSTKVTQALRPSLPLLTVHTADASTPVPPPRRKHARGNVRMHAFTAVTRECSTPYLAQGSVVSDTRSDVTSEQVLFTPAPAAPPNPPSFTRNHSRTGALCIGMSHSDGVIWMQSWCLAWCDCPPLPPLTTSSLLPQQLPLPPPHLLHRPRYVIVSLYLSAFMVQSYM